MNRRGILKGTALGLAAASLPTNATEARALPKLDQIWYPKWLERSKELEAWKASHRGAMGVGNDPTYLQAPRPNIGEDFDGRGGLLGP